MIVYIVGYEDYEGMDIHGVFSSREKALYAERLFRCDIREMELDALPDIAEGHFVYSVRIGIGGEINDVSQRCYESERYGIVKDGSVAWFVVHARDEEEAVSIASKRAEELRSTGKWVFPAQ